MITLSIDLTHLDKKRFKTITRRNGKQAVFCDIVLFETPDGQYGDYIVKQGVSKEEREARLEMPILGNGKIIGRRGKGGPSAKHSAPSEPPHEDEVPF